METAVTPEEASQQNVSQTPAVEPTSHDDDKKWYVMRDLRRANNKYPAYRQLDKEQFQVFTPMKWKLTQKNGKRMREEVPFIHDLLFVYATKTALDGEVKRLENLQYRYIRGGYCKPMTVGEKEMNRFIQAVQSTPIPRYYTPDELDHTMLGQKVRIVGGPLDGYDAILRKMRGTKNRRIFITLQQLLVVEVEVNPEYLQI